MRNGEEDGFETKRSRTREGQGAGPSLPHPALALGHDGVSCVEITTHRIEIAMVTVAGFIAEDGERYLPVFQRLEREFDDRDEMERALLRALSMANRKGVS